MTADKSAEHPTDAAELDPNSLAAIRDLLATEAPAPELHVADEDLTAQERAHGPVSPADDSAQIEVETIQAQDLVQEDLVHAAVAASQPDGARTRRKWGLKRSLRKPKVATPPKVKAQATAKVQAKAKAQPKAASQGNAMFDILKAKVLGYRPTRRHIMIAIAAYLILFRPWLVLGLVVLLAFIITAVFLILGYDGFWRQIMRLARWYAQRHPSRSGEIHRKLDTFAMKFDAFLDRFPEGTVDGLYLPDFGDLAEAEAKHDEALDRRFDKLRESEA